MKRDHPTKPRPTFRMRLEGYNEIAMCERGPMLFNRHDQFIGASLRKYGEFCSGETDLFRELIKPGNVVVELGANIGVHTVELSRLVGDTGTVFAFEPQRLVYQTLCANLALNSCRNVFAHQIAIGETSGQITVPVLSPDLPANFGGVSLLNVGAGEIVPVHCLDNIGLKACDFIKIDIEGMEVQALRGAADVIARLRPVLYVENDRPEQEKLLLTLLKSWNFNIYAHQPPLFSPKNYANEKENIFKNIVSANILCLPAERDSNVLNMTSLVE